MAQHTKDELAAIRHVAGKLEKDFTADNVLAAGWCCDSTFVIVRKGDYLECWWDDGEVNAHPVFDTSAQIEAECWKQEIEGEPDHLLHMNAHEAAYWATQCIDEQIPF